MPSSRQWGDLDRQVNTRLLTILDIGERRVLREYATALNEIRVEMSKLYEKAAGPNGKLTLAEMTKYNRLNSLDKRIAGIMNETYKIVVRDIDRLAPTMYNESFFQYGWAFDQNSGVAITWGQPPADALQAISNNPLDLIAKDSLREGQRIAIRRSISQGLLQGKSYPQMIGDIRKAMGNVAYQAMRIARTEGQRAMNTGTNANYDRAFAQGIQGDVIWDATLDSRTRPTTAKQRAAGINHRVMDGHARGDDGLFRLPNGETAPFPTWPGLSAGQAINCRCRPRFQVEGFSPQIRRTRDAGIIPYTTYANWRPGLSPAGKFNAA